MKIVYKMTSNCIPSRRALFSRLSYHFRCALFLRQYGSEKGISREKESPEDDFSTTDDADFREFVSRFLERYEVRVEVFPAMT